ncbi:UvrD-helicase domain-containing protein [Acidithiobacillus concretivorus]|uniref:ATP-dependent DNA helicase Rep n=1 Tax=Acidithiobacillus concretivorus TaxID=3063952 RepID=A0ABS5ZNW1_9PROT|nr:UvrD-helicase domain-containing protein [Acidithiobacillus concretivorus]
MADALNAPQLEAVHHVHGPLLVLAGAGSGKTRVITRKIVHLIRDQQVAPKHICAVTFTNKAAREMKSRVSQSLQGHNSRGLMVSTFHRLGLDILRKDIERLGYRNNFSVIDPGDSLSMVRNLLRDANGPSDLAEAIQARISRFKNDGFLPQEAQGEDRLGEEAAAIYKPYQRALSACNAVDLDDLILLPTRLLQENEEARLAWQDRIRYLLVDEYQDSNGAQYRLIRNLLGVRHNLTAVGDDDQSIYSWRGAAADNLHRLAQDYPALKVIKLEQNYRSTGRILQSANAVIAQNPHLFEKRLWSNLGDGHPIRVLNCADENDEAEQVVNAILRDRFQRQGEYRDYAILYRSNHQSRPFEAALRNAHMPYQISGGLSFFERSEIKDFLAYLRLLSNPDDDPAFLRAVNTPRRGIGSSTLEKLGEFAKAQNLSLFAAVWEDGLELPEKGRNALRSFAGWVNLKADEIQKAELMPALQSLPDDIGYLPYLHNEGDEKDAARRWENIQELLAWMQRLQEHEDGPQTLVEILNRLMLFNLLEREEDDDRDVLRLSTLHAAKGLEFPQVFLVGAEEELLPHRNSETSEQIAEERRLFYVGMTRARFRLTLSRCRKRRRYGQDVNPKASRFLQEIPKEHLDWQGADSEEETLDPAVAFARLREMLGKN